MKILVVEDTIGEPVQSLLRKSGHDVELVTDGAGARAKLAQPGFDLFLLDWQLPDGSGLDLVRTIREDARHRDAPILMMSSRTDRADIVTAIRSGIDGYLAKPFRPAELRGRIEEVWQRRSRQRDERQKVELILAGQTPLERHGEGPLVILGEEAISEADLLSPTHARSLEYLAAATTTMAAANAFLPDLDLGYCLSGSTGDVTKLLRQRATRDRVQLAVVSTQCQGNCLVMARLLNLRDPGQGRLCVVTERWSDLSAAERSELEGYKVPVFHRDDLDADRWRDIIEVQVIQRWSPELHAKFVDSGLRDAAVWDGLDLPTG